MTDGGDGKNVTEAVAASADTVGDALAYLEETYFAWLVRTRAYELSCQTERGQGPWRRGSAATCC